MWIELTIGALAAAAPLQERTDTVVPLPAGGRVAAQLMTGEITVRTWDRPSVRIEARHGSRTHLRIRTVGSTVRIEPEDRHGIPGIVELTLTVPAAAGLDLGGVHADVSVSGVRGPVEVESVQGDITVRDVASRLTLSTVDGDIVVEGARGESELQAVSGDIRVTNLSGDVSAQTMSGNVLLQRVTADRVVGATASGDVTFTGTLRAGGRYVLKTHSGDVTLAVPEGTGAAISVATFSGELDSEFAVPIKSIERGRRMEFTVGDGGAKVELEAFSGTIRLARAVSANNREE